MEVFRKHDDHVGGRVCAPDLLLASSRRVVYGSVPQAEGPEILEDRDLSAKPDHGFRVRHAVLHPVRGRRPDQLSSHEHGHYQRANQIHVDDSDGPRARGIYELHHVGQSFDSPFAELDENSEHGDGNQKTLHPKTEDSWRNDKELVNQYNKEKAEHWKTRSKEG